MSSVVTLQDQLSNILESSSRFIPELILVAGIFVVILTGLWRRGRSMLCALSAVFFIGALISDILQFNQHAAATHLFLDMLISDDFALYLRILFDIGGLFTVVLSWSGNRIIHRVPEYLSLLMAAVLGAHLLVMSVNFVMVFISLELVSIASYVLAGFTFSKQGAEGSFKYFLFGSVSSAIMLYGMTMIYGITGELNFSTPSFTLQLMNAQSTLLFIAALMVAAGFFYKIAAAPLHPWAPDVYEASPMPVIAFFSVVPKLAGIGVLTRFVFTFGLTNHPVYDWQKLIAIVSILTLTVGNFSALWQKSTKRLMAYSSIGQTGFLLVAIATFMSHGIQFMLFYATVYAITNFLVFLYLQFFEDRGMVTLESFSGVGKSALIPSLFILTGLIALTGLPPTAGFTSKLFIFSSLWEAYQSTGKSILLWLLTFGLLNTVVSLFYYIRIPFFAFVRPGPAHAHTNILQLENLLGLILVLAVLILFFNPGLLMGWINKINFVL